jgi:hypothetical protein
MNANASAAGKVLPIAKIPIKKIGRLRISAETIGKSAAGRQLPSRFRNQKSEGAYASEKMRAAMASEVIVALLRFARFKLSPSTTTNINMMAESPTNQEPIEMQMSFMESFLKRM